MKRILLAVLTMVLVFAAYPWTRHSVSANQQMYAQEKQEQLERQSEKIFARVTFTGRTGVDKANLNKLFHHLEAGIEDSQPTPPCPGGVLVVWQSGWEVIDGKTVFVDRITWRCPDGHLETVTVVWK